MTSLLRNLLTVLVSLASVSLGLAQAVSVAPAWVHRYDSPAHGDDRVDFTDYRPGVGVTVIGTSVDSQGATDLVITRLTASGGLVWRRTYSGMTGPFFRKAIVDGAGAVLLTYTSNTGNGVLLKYNGDGSQAWVSSYTGRANDMKVTDSLQIILAGYFVSGNDLRAFVYSYNPNGTLQGSYVYDGGESPRSDSFHALTIQGNGIYAVGATQRAATGNDALVVRLSPFAFQQWTQRVDLPFSPSPANGNDSAAAVGIDPAGDLVVVGSTRARANPAGTTSEGDNFMAAKLNATTGAILWTKVIHGVGTELLTITSDHANRVAFDQAGNIYVGGQMLPPNVASRYLIVALTSSGTERWRSVGTESVVFPSGDLVQLFAADGNGDLRVVYTTSAADDSVRDIRVAKYRATGSGLVWDYRHTPGVGQELSREAVLAADGSIYVAGATDIRSPDFLALRVSATGSLVASGTYSGPTVGSDVTKLGVDEATGRAFVSGRSRGGPGTGLYDQATVAFDLTVTAPRVANTSIASNGRSPAYAKVGDVITSTLATDAALASVTATIAGRAATVSGSAMNWTAQWTVTADAPEGLTSFLFSYSGAGGIAGSAAAPALDGSTVIIDRTPPTMTRPGDAFGNARHPGEVFYGFATAQDSSGVVQPLETTYSPPLVGGRFQPGLTTITWTATDFAGNQATTTSRVFINPVIEMTRTGSTIWTGTGGVDLSMLVYPRGGQFSGAGVTSAGFFDPVVAGPGVHTLTYVYSGAAVTFNLTVTTTPPTRGTIDPSWNITGQGVPYGAALQTDGKLVTGGFFNFSGGINGQTVGDVLRLTAGAALDGTFTAAGTAFNVVIQPDGKVVLGGDSTGSTDIRRVNADGTPDTGFSAAVQMAPVTILPDGKILGWRAQGVVRMHPNGALDQSWPVSGLTLTGMALQDDGKYVVNGYDAGNVWRVARLKADGTPDGSFASASFGAGAWIRAMLVMGNGKIVVAGLFTSVNGVARTHIARLNGDGTLDSTFGPVVQLGGLGEGVRSVVAQADGQILIGGEIEQIDGLYSRHLVRLNANGSKDVAFTPLITAAALPMIGGATAPVIQGDGRILVAIDMVDYFFPNPIFTRLFNDPAVQVLSTPNGATVLWQRGGSAPETQQVSFEVSTDAGATWSLLGHGTRVSGGWNLTGLNLPASGLVRARARTVSGEFASSSGIVEQVAAISFTPGGNTPPVAVADRYEVPVGEMVEMEVLANDSDADLDALRITGVSDSVGGAAYVTAGNVKVHFVPTPGRLGDASFKYTISDGRGGTATATVTLTQVSMVPLVMGPRAATSWAAFAMTSGGMTVSDTTIGGQAVTGDVGLTGGLLQTQGSARVAGSVYLQTGANYLRAGTSTVTGTIFRGQAADRPVIDGFQALQRVTRAAAGLASTPGYPSAITAGTSLTATGTVVLNLTSLTLPPGHVLSLNGGATTKYIINVTGNFVLNGGSVLLGPGLPPGNVLFHVPNAGNAVTLNANARLNGVLLAPARAVTVANGSMVTGSVLAGSVSVSTRGRLVRVP